MSHVVSTGRNFERNSSSKRINFFKINLTESEMKVFVHKEKKVNFLFSENNLTFNVNEYFRIFLLNFDNSDLQQLMMRLYASDVHPAFKAKNENTKTI